VPAPGGESSTWEEELWRLRRRYEGGGAFALEEAEDGSRVVRLTFHCTDPDWEAVNWAPEGLPLEIVVPAAYPDASPEAPRLRLLGQETCFPERFLHFAPLLFEEAAKQAPPQTPAVYRALQHLDRHLTALWMKIRNAERLAEDERNAAVAAAAAKLEAAKAEACRQKAKAEETAQVLKPWSAEEQARLESALVEFRGEADVRRRWALIAGGVGGGRSARECAERFRACREFALGKTESPDLPAPASPGSAVPPPAVSGWSAEEVRRQGVEVRLLGLALEGFATLLPRILRLQVVCGRCRKPADLVSEALASGAAGASSGSGSISACEARTAEAPCLVCKQELSIRVAPSICFGGCPALAHVLGIGCHPTQLLRSDVEATCGKCNDTIVARNVGPGYRRRSECAGCFAKLNLAVEGAELLGQGVAHWRKVAEQEGEHLNARRQLQEARRHERELGIRAGQPLPEKGCCKHFSKSYRWLRFPCCGRAFPCPECHDEQMDHPHEWANRMLCGHCSHEQPFSKDKCASCGAAQTRSKSAFWEGGQGCRNAATMSKNDSHKYRGLGKTVSVPKGAK